MKYKLGDVIESISETFEKDRELVVLINTSDVYDGKILNHKFVKNENLKGQFKKKFQKGDILYSEIRPMNRRFAYVDFSSEGYVASTKLMVIRKKSDIINTRYLFHILKSQEMVDKLQMLAESRSGTFPQITFNELANLDIEIPSLETQTSIEYILDSIENKIELNSKLKDNLAELKATLFKAWFIDFIDEENIINTDSSCIPNNWKKGTFSKIIEETIGGDWGKESPEGNYIEEVYCIRGADIPEVKAGNKGKMPIRYILHKNFINKGLEENDLVIEISGGSPTQSTGRITEISKSLLKRYDKGMICTNFCRAIKPKVGYSSFIYSYWQYLYDKGIMFSYENGTTGIKNLDINSLIENEEIVIPPKEKVDAFNKVVCELNEMIYLNGFENEKLSNLRDLLLPKLLSGEIGLENIELDTL